MSHDLRSAIGYREIKSNDPEEQRLRDALFRARGIAVQHPTPQNEADARIAESVLSDYLWARSCRIVAEDRKKHPKKKRNAPVPEGALGSGRALP